MTGTTDFPTPEQIATLKCLPDAVLVFDKQWHVAYANREAIKVLGREDLVGKYLDDLTRGHQGTYWHVIAWDSIQKMLHGGRSSALLWCGQSLSTHASYLRNEDSKPLGAIVVLRSISQEVAAQWALDAMLAVANHEMHTPSNTIINLAELLQQAETLDPDTVISHARSIAAAANRQDTLFANFLEYATLRANARPPTLSTFDPRAAIEQAMINARVKMSDHDDLVLSCTLFDQLPPLVTVDRRSVEHALTNLLDNAIKFTTSGTITVSAGRDGDKWHVSVSDTGCGIDPSTLPVLFQPFRLAEQPVTRQHQGAGLGLAVAHELVSQMGGSIDVDSTPGVGSTFTISLPTEPPPPAPPLQAWIIDDHGCSAEIATMAFRTADFQTSEFHFAAQAMDRLDHMDADTEPDLVVLDIRLHTPTDSLEILNRIRSNPRLQDIPVLAYTSSPEDIDQPGYAGITQVLKKPFGFVDMRDLAQRYAAQLRAEAELNDQVGQEAQ